MVSAVLDIDEIKGITLHSQRHLSLSLTVAIALHLLLAAVWGVVEYGRTTPQPLLPKQPVVHAMLISVPEPAPAAIAPPRNREQSPLKPISQHVAPQPSTVSRIVVPQQPAAAAEQAPSFREPSPQSSHSIAQLMKEVAMVPESYTPPSSDVAYASNPKPNYPLAAKHRGMEGVVELMVLVDENGEPLSVEVKNSSGFMVLDREALKAVTQWRFKPAVRDGESVAGEVVVPIRFQLGMS